ncbi:MAG: hypothetical protein EPO13_02665 [Actinomycetota bacterium]|nr:MAG: hypothetical protein EPO13_02665 [Actinomycetota bacterium]
MAISTGRRPRSLLIATAATALEAVALLLYAVLLAVQGLFWGTTTTDISSGPGLVVELVVYAALGVGLAVVARGLWARRGWARSPALLAQLFVLVVAVPLLRSPDAVPRVAGAVAAVVAAAGAVAVLMPAVTRELGLLDRGRPAS